jgi:ornithine cyclodeaminase/alanine dehydrogenase-like protein (mu-crystallin family)
VVPPRTTRSPRTEIDASTIAHIIVGRPAAGSDNRRVAFYFTGEDVMRAVSPADAYRAVRDGFVAYARGDWTMQPKLYVTNYPAGDFRAMPALGAGHALLKWVTSFPGNPARGLPTVSGLVLLSDADTGVLQAVLDAGSVTALRTGAAAVLAATTLGRGGSTAVVGCGVNGAATARTFAALGLDLAVWDVDADRAAGVAQEIGCTVARSREAALAADVVVTVTPGKEILFPAGSLRSGQHVSLMGADGPGKAEIAAAELAGCRLFCDDWEQASHGGEFAAGVAAGTVTRADVTELGPVLNGDAPGRRADGEITLFDSTGLAIQDLAIARLALHRADELGVRRL